MLFLEHKLFHDMFPAPLKQLGADESVVRLGVYGLVCFGRIFPAFSSL